MSDAPVQPTPVVGDSATKRARTPSQKQQEAEDITLAEAPKAKKSKGANKKAEKAAKATAGQQATPDLDGASAGDAEKTQKSPRANPDSREKVCRFRSAEQRAKPMSEPAGPVQITPVLELVLPKGDTLTIRPGDLVTHWTLNKAHRKVEFLVFRIQKTVQATNWTLIGRESNKDGQLLRFPAADIISATAALAPEDTLQERTTALATLDHSAARKIEDVQEEESRRKKAKKDKKASKNKLLRPTPTPISSSHLAEATMVREAVATQITPLVGMLELAVEGMNKATEVLKVTQAMFVTKLETLSEMGKSLATLASK